MKKISQLEVFCTPLHWGVVKTSQNLVLRLDLVPRSLLKNTSFHMELWNEVSALELWNEVSALEQGYGQELGFIYRQNVVWLGTWYGQVCGFKPCGITNTKNLVPVVQNVERGLWQREREKAPPSVSAFWLVLKIIRE